MDYLSYFLKIPNLTAIGLLSTFLLVLLRMAPIVSIAPFFGAKVAPVPARAGVAICLSIALLPTVIHTTTHNMAFDMAFIGYSAKELLIGFMLGFLITIPFYVAQTAGSLIDFMRGSSFMMAQDITLQVQASPIGILYNYMLILIFFELNGPFLFLDAVVKSYQIVPADAFFSPSFFKSTVPFWKTSMDLMNHIFTIAIQVGAPALVAILMAETFLGIANRLAPQVQIAFLGMSLKSFVGLLLLWTAWFFILKQLGKVSIDWIKTINDLLNHIPVLK